ncbi:MAG: putative salicylate hydroxylase [Caudoviricetes sp.]|nr:MAG: putative salicylate hydroxylase [Caudoviricetes sp.]
MDTPTIIALIASIGAGISGIAATITCIFTYKTTHPNLKIEISKDQCVYTHYGEKSFAFMPITIRNTAMVGGMIDAICIKYNNKDYPAEDIHTNFDLSPFRIESPLDYKVERTTKHLRLKCPILVNGFSVVDGFIIFPTFPAIQIPTIKVRIKYRLINKNFKSSKSRTFSFITADSI